MFAQMNCRFRLDARALVVGHLAGITARLVRRCGRPFGLRGCRVRRGRSRSVATAWRRSELRVPVYGTLVRKRALSRLSRRFLCC